MEFTSLYQKYRPQTFSEIIGQDHIRTTLLSELKTSAVSHAYLFSGPRGTGKTTTARLLARAINCLKPKENGACNECQNCQQIRNNKALDIIEMDAASHTGVEHVRENIIENARVVPTILPWKVFIIDEVHMLSTSAFNALLKTLEEPPQKTMFIFATTEVHKVPATIASRCEQFQFRKVAFKDILTRLKQLTASEGRQVEEAVLQAIVKRSEGALRDAESLLGQILSLDDGKITPQVAEIVLPHHDTKEMVEWWQEMVEKKLASAVNRVSRMYEDGIILSEFAKEFLEFLRKILLYKVQNSTAALEYLDINEKQLKQIIKLTKICSAHEIARQIRIFINALEQCKNTLVPQLPLELAVVEIIEPFGGESEMSSPTIPTPTKNNEDKLVLDKNPKEEQLPELKEETAKETDSSLTIKGIGQNWTSVLNEMKHHNHALHLTFQVGRLVAYDPQTRTLTLGFQYRFYQDRLQDKRNIPVIEKVLQKIFNQPLRVRAVTGNEYSPLALENNSANVAEPTAEEVKNVWDLAEAAFGGKIKKDL